MKNTLFIICLLMLRLSAFACDCKSEAVSMEAIAKYDFIFSGKVVAISGCEGSAHVKFVIDSLYRGKSFRSTELEFDCRSDCQMSFTPEEQWIIYAKYTSYGKAKVDFCSFSRMKMADEKNDYNTAIHGMTYEQELVFLKTNLGIQPFNVAKNEDTQHHELLHPTSMQQVWLLLASLVGIGVFYFVVKKLLR